MKRDLSNFGVAVTSTTRGRDGFTMHIDSTELVESLNNFRTALEATSAAWEALPSGVQDHLSDLGFAIIVPGSRDDSAKPFEVEE